MFEIIPSSYLISKKPGKAFFGAFIAGISEVFSPHRLDPGAHRTFSIVNKGSILWGILLLLLYSIGHGILAVVAELSIGFVRNFASSDKYGKASTVLKIVMGADSAHRFFI